MRASNPSMVALHPSVAHQLAAVGVTACAITGAGERLRSFRASPGDRVTLLALPRMSDTLVAERKVHRFGADLRTVASVDVVRDGDKLRVTARSTV